MPAGFRFRLRQGVRRIAHHIACCALRRTVHRAVRRRQHRPHDLPVARAPAQHPAERIEHLRLGRRAWPVEQGARRHQHARRADPALRRAVLVERPLQPAQATVLRQPLDRGNRAASHLAERHQAGADLLSVQQHRAGAAIPRVAADLGAGQSEMVAEHAREPGGGRRIDLDRPPVDEETVRLGRAATGGRTIRFNRAPADVGTARFDHLPGPRFASSERAGVSSARRTGLRGPYGRDGAGARPAATRRFMWERSDPASRQPGGMQSSPTLRAAPALHLSSGPAPPAPGAPGPARRAGGTRRRRARRRWGRGT